MNRGIGVVSRFNIGGGGVDSTAAESAVDSTEAAGRVDSIVEAGDSTAAPAGEVV